VSPFTRKFFKRRKIRSLTAWCIIIA
jgi:hypothetical protein